MKPSTRNQAKGELHAIKGKAKEAVGRLTNDPDLEAEGTVEKTQGKVQKKLGQIGRSSGSSGTLQADDVSRLRGPGTRRARSTCSLP